MKLAESLIAWDTVTGKVAVGPLIFEGDNDWTTPYGSTGGAAFIAVRKMTGIEARHYVMSDLGLVLRDGLDPKAVHAAFLKIDEYRQAIPRDVQGAEDGVND